MTYLTTPIYYVNGAPHIGHAYTTVIADALARWHRTIGRRTRLITGTDEHGLKVQRAAAEAGLAPAALAEATAGRFRHAWDRLGIGYDDFVRTTSDRHRSVVTELLQRVYDGGWVRPGRYQGRYCVGCEAYVAADACPVHRRATEHVDEENWFFRLSAFEARLAGWFEEFPDAVRPAPRRNEALGLLRQGLIDFSISRSSITWGVPLPWDPAQVAYVWFDALGTYLTAAGWPDAGFRRWWPAHHVIGKDILRFHAIYWPAMLFAAGLEPPSRITVHGFLLGGATGGAASGGAGGAVGKISKSGAPTDDLDGLLDTFGADGLRFHLLRHCPVGPDGQFSREAVLASYNADLANTLGNLVARVTALAASRHASIAPAPDPASPLSTVAARCVDEAGRAWEDVAPSEALAAVWRLVAAANSYLVARRPWAEPPGDRAAAYAVGDVLEVLRIAAILAAPAVPGAAAEIWRRIGAPGPLDAACVPDDVVWGDRLTGVRVRRGAPLFPRLAAPVLAGVQGG